MNNSALHAVVQPRHLSAAVVVRCVGVTKTYRVSKVRVRALNRIDLVVRHGEFIAIMGPSGSGKSTLVHALAGLTRVDSGVVEVAGVAVHMARDRELSALRRNQVGLVFQFANLLPRLSLRENVELPYVLAGLRPASGTVDNLLERLGLSHRSDHLPAELSGGEQQRAALARALAHNPSVLLADEPTGSLDSRNTASLCALFSELRSAGQSLIVSTHNDEVAAYADRVVHMRDGEVDVTIR